MISAKAVRGKTVEAQDGHIGLVEDLYFDDQVWKIRYLVVNTGKWLPGRKVLIAPEAILQCWHGESGLPVNLTKDQIKSSPDFNAAEPISRRVEQILYSHYEWKPYWTATDVATVLPQLASSLEERREAIQQAESAGDPHLHSVEAIRGYLLQAADGESGSLEDFLIDDENSSVHFLVVETEKSGAQRKVLISADSISRIDWAESRVISNLSCHVIENSPEYKPEA